MVLRSGVGPITQDNRYPHSGIAENLWLDLLETEVLKDLHIAFYSGMAAIYSHPSIDCQKGVAAINAEFKRLTKTIPYIGKGNDNEDITPDRLEAVKRYKQLMSKIKRDK